MIESPLTVRVMGAVRFQEGLTYLIPKALHSEIQLGVFVEVPMGSRTYCGIVTEINPPLNFDPEKLKPILQVITERPVWDQALQDLWRWMSSYYHELPSKVLTTMLPKVWLSDRVKLAKPTPKAPPVPITPALYTLNLDQQGVLEKIQWGQFCPILLMGVTGSGKTEVYLHAIQQVLDQGRQALLLVPEIGLTHALMSSIQTRLTHSVALFHSGMTDLARAREALSVAKGEKLLIVGTRSAIFLPIKALGLIIMDEEHDTSYKQESGVRYQARDVAIKRAQLSQIPIILGSATPSLESILNAERKKYQWLMLSSQFHPQASREIYPIDLRREVVESGLSQSLLSHIQETLQAKRQVMLFLNRRGYAPVLRCKSCGWSAKCRACDTYMTVHHHPIRLVCHHCGLIQHPPSHCPSCESSEWQYQGMGTERLEQALQAKFPEARIARIDRTSMDQKDRLPQQLEAIHQGDIDVIIGTQMIAKGHHFQQLGLVGILDMDAGLFSPDFRALEHTVQLLVQICGRVGREGLGRVLIQTHQPDHPVLQAALTQPYLTVARQMLETRQQGRLPPFAYFAQLRWESTDPQAPMVLLEKIKSQLSQRNAKTPEFPHAFPIEILGPVPALQPKKSHFYRAHLLLSSVHRKSLHAMLDQLSELLPKRPSKTHRWVIDVDPMSVV